MAELVFFSDTLIELNNEVIHHPLLMDKLATNPNADLGDKLGLIAYHVGIPVNEVFHNQEEMDRFCYILYNLLRDKRKAIITLN